MDDSAASQSVRVWNPGDRIDRYELGEVIGSGGMGVVWSARDTALDREVAIKVIRSSARPEPMQLRLLGEARAMARLSHPNVVTVHDIGTVEGSLFVAMERVDGGTLRDWLSSVPQPWTEVVTKFIGAGRGLGEAHRSGLVHRDFKPDNVLMARGGVPRVSDFGLALELNRAVEAVPVGPDPAEPAVSQESHLVGTLAYMAPEQLLGEKLTGRSDQFGFCVALYEGLYGVRPFAPLVGEAVIPSLLSVIREGRMTAPLASSDVPKRVRAAVLRGLSFDGGKRWSSMDALVAELERCMRRRWRLLSASLVGVVVWALVALAGYWNAASPEGSRVEGAQVAATAPLPVIGTKEGKEKALKFMDEGSIQYNVGRWQQAIGQWSLAYAIYNAPEFLFNMAQAYRQEGNCELAIFLYGRYLWTLPNAKNRDEVEGFITEMESQCAFRF